MPSTAGGECLEMRLDIRSGMAAPRLLALAQEHHEYPRSTRLIEVQNIDVVGGVFHFEVSIVNAAPLVDNIGDVDVSSIEVYA